MFFLITLLSINSNADQLTEKLRIYGIIKPQSISTAVALGTGLVHKLPSKIGNKVSRGNTLLQVLEKDSIRSYRSTIDGYVAKNHITPGAAVSPGMPLVTVVAPEKKYMEISLSPLDAKRVTKGTLVQESNGNELGRIDRISPIIDPDTGAVVANLSLKDSNFRIGEVIPIDIILGEKECDQVSILSNVGDFGKEYKILFVNEQKACLVKKEK